jgi:hypothetical protein
MGREIVLMDKNAAHAKTQGGIETVPWPLSESNDGRFPATSMRVANLVHDVTTKK